MKWTERAAPIIDMDSFCKGFSTLVQDSLQCCANAQTGPLSFAALLSFSVYHVSLQFQSLEVRKQLRSKHDNIQSNRFLWWNLRKKAQFYQNFSSNILTVTVSHAALPPPRFASFAWVWGCLISLTLRPSYWQHNNWGKKGEVCTFSKHEKEWTIALCFLTVQTSVNNSSSLLDSDSLWEEENISDNVSG